MNRAVRLVSALAASSLLGGPAAAQGSYPLTCRPGAGMTVDFRGDERIAFVNFRPAKKAASSGLEPGTCAWSDRGFRSGEPGCLYKVVGTLVLTMRDGAVRDIHADGAPFVENVLEGGGVFIVHARRRGNCLEVTRIGP